jgi:hypothetical protein
MYTGFNSKIRESQKEHKTYNIHTDTSYLQVQQYLLVHTHYDLSSNK